VQELKKAMDTVPELRLVLGEHLSQSLIELASNKVKDEEAKLTLKTAFTTLMSLSKDVVASTVSDLIGRLVRDKQACLPSNPWFYAS
jgi:hypothetical protein